MLKCFINENFLTPWKQACPIGFPQLMGKCGAPTPSFHGLWLRQRLKTTIRVLLPCFEGLVWSRILPVGLAWPVPWLLSPGLPGCDAQRTRTLWPQSKAIWSTGAAGWVRCNTLRSVETNKEEICTSKFGGFSTYFCTKIFGSWNSYGQVSLSLNTLNIRKPLPA